MKKIEVVCVLFIHLFLSCTNVNERDIKLMHLNGNVVKIETVSLTNVPIMEMSMNNDPERCIAAAEGNYILTFNRRGNIIRYQGFGIDNEELFDVSPIRGKKIMAPVSIGNISISNNPDSTHFEQNEADLAFFAYSEPMPFEWIPLKEENVIAAVPEDHRLAGNTSFPISECADEDFIMGSWGKEQEIIEILERYDVHPQIKYTTYDTPATLAMVRMGLGISFVNELSAQFWNEHLVKIPLDPPQTINFGIAVPSKDRMTNAAGKFLDYAIAYMENYSH